MKKVLIISPRFPSVNAPDHHRVRTSLPFYLKYGWEPTVLAVTPETVGDSISDPALSASVPEDVRVERVPAWREDKVRRFGFGNVEYRALLPLYRAGTRLLKEQRFDLIYFSTTAFFTLVLAPIWKRRFGCRIVFDIQDPWHLGNDHNYTRENAPGGWTKYQLTQVISRYGEAFAMGAADHVISVSPDYIDMLSSRYPRLSRDKFTVIPFGAAQRDYETRRKLGIQPGFFQPGDGMLHWVYVGRGGPDMDPVLSVLFRALAKFRETEPELARRIRLHFVGTNYAPSHRTFKVIEPLAVQHGVGDLVREYSERVPYFQAMACMAESDAVLLVGSVNKQYTASKLFNCVLSKKPVFALFHVGSLVSQIITRFPNARLAQFEDDLEKPEFLQTVVEGLRWMTAARFDETAIEAATEPFSAERLTAAQCGVFNQITP